MSWEIDILFGDFPAGLLYVGLLVAAVSALAVTIVAIRRRRDHADQNDLHQSSSTNSEQCDMDDDATSVFDDYDEDRTRASMTEADDLRLDDMPAFSSLLVANEWYERLEAADTLSEAEAADDVSSLLFGLLGTKARICELDRAERSKSWLLESTFEVLERLKGTLKDFSPEFQEEVEEMRDLIAAELMASRQSFESALELKEIIEAQCDLLKHPDANHSAEFLSAKQSYVESVDASLERRLKIAERREREFALGKERIMALRNQMLKIMDAQPDAAQTH